MKRRTFFGTVAAGLASLVGIKGAEAGRETEQPKPVFVLWDEQTKRYVLATIRPMIGVEPPAQLGDSPSEHYVVTSATVTGGTAGRIGIFMTCEPRDATTR